MDGSWLVGEGKKGRDLPAFVLAVVTVLEAFDGHKAVVVTHTAQ